MSRDKTTKEISDYLPQLTSSRELISSAKTALTKTYPDLYSFSSVFNPSEQNRFCRDIERCVDGKSPSLVELDTAYGTGAAVIWLIPQIFDLSEYCGCKTKLSEGQLEACAQAIYNTYYHLKCTEIMLFFFRFKGGNYGKFYGSVDPLVIMEGLKKFLEYRDSVISKIEARKDKEDAERLREELKSGMTYAQFLKWKENHKEEWNNIKKEIENEI